MLRIYVQIILCLLNKGEWGVMVITGGVRVKRSSYKS